MKHDPDTMIRDIRLNLYKSAEKTKDVLSMVGCLLGHAKRLCDDGDIDEANANVSVRARSCLKKEGYVRWSDLCCISVDQILEFRMVGVNTAKEIVDELTRRHIPFLGEMQ